MPFFPASAQTERSVITEIIAVSSIVGAAILNGGGSALLKYSSVYKSSPHSRVAVFWLIFIGALALFGGSFPFYAYGLSKLKLSIAQPVFSVGTYTAVALMSFFLFHEPYSIVKIAGLAVIILGVLIVANA